MEIGGSLFPVSPYSGTDPSRKYPQHSPQQVPQPPHTPPSLKQAIKPEASSDENKQRRFYSLDRDLSHSARQALNTYRDSEEVANGELMNRVDVFA